MPGNLDFDQLQAIIAAKTSEARDHLLALREDPGYFDRHAFICFEHKSGNVLDAKRKPHPLLGTARSWKDELRRIVFDAHTDLSHWKNLESRVTELSRLQRTYAEQIKRERHLPKDCTSALRQFDYSLQRTSRRYVERLGDSVHGSPNARSQFVRVGDGEMFPVGLKSKANKNKLMRYFQLMWNGLRVNGGLSDFRLATLCDEMWRLLSRDAVQKTLLSALVTQLLSDLSVVGECINQLWLFQPWIRMVHTTHIDIEAVGSTFDQDIDSCFQLQVAGLDYAFGKAIPTDGKFYYPEEKCRTRDVVKAMRKAEKHLDNFWVGFDSHISSSLKESDRSALHDLVGEYEIRRTLRWVEPEIDKIEKVIQASVSEVVEPGPTPHLSRMENLQLEPEEATPSAKKVKTKGVAWEGQDSAFQLHESPAAPQLIPEQESYKVSAQDLETFAFLFFNVRPHRAAPGGQLPWLDFLKAMSALEFKVEMMFGPRWQFTPTTNGARTVSFDEPHPGSKLDSLLARHYGRRLTRAYGWTGSSFELK